MQADFRQTSEETGPVASSVASPERASKRPIQPQPETDKAPVKVWRDGEAEGAIKPLGNRGVPVIYGRNLRSVLRKGKPTELVRPRCRADYGRIVDSRLGLRRDGGAHLVALAGKDSAGTIDAAGWFRRARRIARGTGSGRAAFARCAVA